MLFPFTLPDYAPHTVILRCTLRYSLFRLFGWLLRVAVVTHVCPTALHHAAFVLRLPFGAIYYFTGCLRLLFPFTFVCLRLVHRLLPHVCCLIPGCVTRLRLRLRGYTRLRLHFTVYGYARLFWMVGLHVFVAGLRITFGLFTLLRLRLPRLLIPLQILPRFAFYVRWC